MHYLRFAGNRFSVSMSNDAEQLTITVYRIEPFNFTSRNERRGRCSLAICFPPTTHYLYYIVNAFPIRNDRGTQLGDLKVNTAPLFWWTTASEHVFQNLHLISDCQELLSKPETRAIAEGKQIAITTSKQYCSAYRLSRPFSKQKSATEQHKRKM